MDVSEERKLKEPFDLEREQCRLLLNGVEKMCGDLRYYQNELKCNVIDEELNDRIMKITREVAEKDVSLKNTLVCIQSSLDAMKEQFINFQVDEDQEVFYPSYEMQLKEQIKAMNDSEIARDEVRTHRSLVNVEEMLRDLKGEAEEEMNGDEDFAEIETESQLDKIPIDPVTQKEIENPVRNRLCRHVYDKDGIFSLINQRQQQKKRAKCPTIGCKADLTFNNLIDDRELKEKIDRLRHNS